MRLLASGLIAAVLLCGFIGPNAVATNCYNPDGSVEQEFNYTPCDPASPVSGVCCSTADYCLSNGMCFDAGANNLVSQGGCTDPLFRAPGCNKVCTGKP